MDVNSSSPSLSLRVYANVIILARAAAWKYILMP